ncbi:hypothetical protein C882_2916 [Caenispirillum salinarum AK4]|uniref:Uncharacterized protein n=1 Tax=Caenispirillum salinarum AK4 TaxID=1238182 RepID=K9H6D6_9PROT|nr:hypothetical protein C882_2916 [Caenispirillum salinarum AK4]
MGPLLHHRLSAVGVVPQIRVLDLGVQFVEAQDSLIVVKDASSAVPSTA